MDSTEAPLTYPRSMRTECILINGIPLPDGKDEMIMIPYKGGEGEPLSSYLIPLRGLILNLDLPNLYVRDPPHIREETFMSPALTPYYTFDGEQLIKGVWELIILDPGSRISWSDLHPYNGEVNEEVLKTIFIVPDLLSGGDYSNSSEVQVSNHRVFLKEFKNVEGVHDVYGAFGSYAVAIRADIAESNEQVKETLDGLENYPVIDDEDMDEIRHEWEQEAVKDMVHSIQNSIDNDLEDFIEDTDVDSDKVESLDLGRYQ